MEASRSLVTGGKTDTLKSSPAHFDLPGAVTTRLKIGQIQIAWTSVTSVNFGGHASLEILRFWRVEISIFGIERRGQRDRITGKIFLVEQGRCREILVARVRAVIEKHIDDTPEHR
jgi:hypothetical protein